MSKELQQENDLASVHREATIKALKGKVDDAELQSFLQKMDDSRNLLGTSNDDRCIEATGSIIVAAVYGKVKCEISSLPYVFDASVWGIGAAGFTALGTIFNAYDPSNWDYFFKKVRKFHAQGIAKGGGVFQITFFDKKNVPIGQFNSVAVGAGVFQVGGEGKWKKR